MVLKVGDTYKCPEGHTGKVVWVQSYMKMIGVRCSKKHAEYSIGKGKVHKKNMVFLITI
jgi:hypothetical protein